ncbi:PqiC family protein [Roseivivax sediminis]|nr:ABC-type transport auxiliary lipoprotein family protein [Roseivivax sediminis]
MNWTTPLGALALTVLAACGGGDIRYATPPSAPEARVGSAYATLEVVEVQLPTYAASEDIFVADAGGALTALGPLWADDPARAMTLQLARDLSAITGAQVAPEPWPFRDYAAAKLDVRLEDMLATAAGTFRLSGQFFVAPDDGGRDRSGRFAIEVPLAEDADAASIAAARSAAVSQLAEDIARRGL